MKVIIDDNKIIVFLNFLDNSFIDNIDVNLKKLLYKLDNYYDIKIKGYYNINVFACDNMVILEMENSCLPDYFDEVDTQVNIFKSSYFLYKIDFDFINDFIINNFVIYKYKNEFYLKFKNSIFFSSILEYSDIIYGEKINEIEKFSKKVNL